MSWRYLLALPLAAILVGKTAKVPALRPPLPASAGAGCDYQWSRLAYLRAWAYARNHREAALRILRAAERELAACRGDTSVLRSRVRELKRELAP